MREMIGIKVKRIMNDTVSIAMDYTHIIESDSNLPCIKTMPLEEGKAMIKLQFL